MPVLYGKHKVYPDDAVIRYKEFVTNELGRKELFVTGRHIITLGNADVFDETIKNKEEQIRHFKRVRAVIFEGNEKRAIIQPEQLDIEDIPIPFEHGGRTYGDRDNAIFWNDTRPFTITSRGFYARPSNWRIQDLNNRVIVINKTRTNKAPRILNVGTGNVNDIYRSYSSNAHPENFFNRLISARAFQPGGQAVSLEEEDIIFLGFQKDVPLEFSGYTIPAVDLPDGFSFVVYNNTTSARTIRVFGTISTNVTLYTINSRHWEGLTATGGAFYHVHAGFAPPSSTLTLPPFHSLIITTGDTTANATVKDLHLTRPSRVLDSSICH